MRITFVISSLAAGGAQRVLIDLASQLAQRGHHAVILTYSSTDLDHFQTPANVQRIALNLLWPSKNAVDMVISNIRRLRTVRAALLETRPDVIVSFIDITNILVLAATRGLGVPVVISERIDPRFHEIGARWRIARRVLYPLSDRLVVQTRSVANWAKRFLSDEKVTVIPNAAPKVDCDADPVQRQDFVLGVGRLHKQKGFDLLVRAFANSGISRQGWRLVIIGEGPERSNLTNLASSLGVRRAFELLGEVEHPSSWYSRCGIFALSSRYEGFPNVLLEAMAHGAPTLSFDCPSGPQDIVDSGTNAVLVSSMDVDTLSSELRRLASDPQVRTRISERARDVQRRFSTETVTEAWEQLLRGLVQPQSP